MSKSVKDDVRVKIAQSYIIDIIKNATDLDPEQDEILCKALVIISSTTIPPQDD